jgi:hypothetical protein
MKTFINKNIKIWCSAVLLSVVTLTSSCKKNFLDIDPQAKQPAVEFWKTPEDAAKGVNAIYANLRSWNNVAFNAIAIESTGSDEADKGSTPTDATFFNLYDAFTVTSTHGTLQDFWTGQYQNINLCNQVLDNVPAIAMDEALKARYLAEAKFVRAYSYFRLVRAYGDVPLRLKVPKDASEYNIPRTSKSEAVLPTSYDADNRGRATKGAAVGMHAKVAMYQKKWSDVLALTSQVMGMGYDLTPNFEKVFRVENENNIESLFEVQATLDLKNKDASNSQYSQIQGVAGHMGWGFNTPSTVLAAAFEAGDPRRDATILFRGETTPQGDVIPMNVPNAMYNQKSYVPFNTKVLDYNEGAQQNVRVLRFADVLLMNAEAANELDNPTQALTSLNRVRARARGGNPAILPDVTTTEKTALRNAIYHERRVELAMESDRYFDVIRQGRGAEVFGIKGWKANKNEVWPIPDTEIQLSGNLLTQNPGY